MRFRVVLAASLVSLLALGAPLASAGDRARRLGVGSERVLPKGFRPAILATRELGRYFVELKAPSLAERGGGRLAPGAQRRVVGSAMRSQDSAVQEVRSLGGNVLFRYARLVNAFSARMSAADAASVAQRADVSRVEPVPIVIRSNETSVPFIGAPQVWRKLGVRGKGMTVAVVDTGVDYTHADFGGPGTPAAYTSNDPSVIEPGSFPTAKVVGGYDFVGANYDVLDASTANDTPVPDPDPLDKDGHGTHVAGTCCGIGVKGSVGKGVAPQASILAVKVWDVGNSTADVLVAGYEFAVDPNGDGNTKDAADVLSFSGGVDYGSGSSIEAKAAKDVVKLGTVFVAAAGNSGNQPNGGSGYILGTPAAAKTVIAVGASIDQFSAQKFSVNAPSGVTLPDGGPIVAQDWAGPLSADVTGGIVDAREFSPVADPDGVPAPDDRMLCDSTPGGSPFGGKIALVFKGPFAAGDCTADDKVLNAQKAGATAVVLWDGFGGLPTQYAPGTSANQVTIPAVSLSGNDSKALAAAISPNAPASYNTVTGNVTLGSTASVIPGYADRMTDFSSEGPARISNDLKPDISAPGNDITSAAVGTGDGSITFSGTSMATPHVSGVATLLRQVHPSWPPAKIKALIMNQATQSLRNLDGSKPVPATVMGSGRVQAYESATTTNLATPGSISFGLQPVHGVQRLVRRVRVTNDDSRAHTYSATASVRYTDFGRGFATIGIGGEGLTATSAHFRLAAGTSTTVQVRLTLNPRAVKAWQQLYGWYYTNPNVDGNIAFRQLGPAGDSFHVSWQVSALAAANTGLSRSALDLTSGSQTMKLTGGGPGVPQADMYLLGTRSPRGSGSEADIAAVGARSFTGATIDGAPAGIPSGTDPYAGLTWQEFLTQDDEPTEPVEFGVWTYGIHNTTESEEIDVVVDVGADGKFADKQVGGDVMVVKLPGPSGTVCVFDLPSTFDTCDATYFQDYSNYNSSVTGLAVDATALGLSAAEHAFSYQVSVCTGAFAGDVPAVNCDVAGDVDPVTGTYGPTLDATLPALAVAPLLCRGFWGGRRCDAGKPIRVGVGSAAPGDDPGILALFPNDAPPAQGAIVRTTT